MTLARLVSGRGGIGGILARRVGRCGELSFLEDGEPGSILLKLYDENRLDARRSSGSCLDNAANVDLVSGGTSGIGSTDDNGGVATSLVSGIVIDSVGRLSTGKDGANLGGLLSGRSSASSSGKVDIRLGGEPGDRTGELVVVISESMENREMGRGLPKLSRLNRSGRGGVGLTGCAGARVAGTTEDEEVDGTGLSVS
jgi:hypothetical protein